MLSPFVRSPSENGIRSAFYVSLTRYDNLFSLSLSPIPQNQSCFFCRFRPLERYTFMLDAGAIVTGVVAGVISGKLLDTIDRVLQAEDYTHEDKVEILLGALIAVTAPKEKENINRSFALQPYPSEFAVNEDWHGKSHFCIFFHDQTPIRFDVEGVGTYLKTVGPGWVQCDVRGRVSTTDAAKHNVLISYRDDAIGAAL